MGEVAVTVRIPEELKEALDAYGKSRDMTQVGVVRAALVAFLAPRNDRVYELPGLSPAFSHFLDNTRRVLLLVASGNDRLQVEGSVDLNLTNESIVALRLAREKLPTPFLRRDVVAWFPAGDGSDRLAMGFLRVGWRPHSIYADGSTA